MIAGSPIVARSRRFFKLLTNGRFRATQPLAARRQNRAFLTPFGLCPRKWPLTFDWMGCYHARPNCGGGMGNSAGLKSRIQHVGASESGRGVLLRVRWLQ